VPPYQTEYAKGETCPPSGYKREGRNCTDQYLDQAAMVRPMKRGNFIASKLLKKGPFLSAKGGRSNWEGERGSL